MLVVGLAVAAGMAVMAYLDQEQPPPPAAPPTVGQPR
jgi:hypothetical protein